VDFHNTSKEQLEKIFEKVGGIKKKFGFGRRNDMSQEKKKSYEEVEGQVDKKNTYLKVFSYLGSIFLLIAAISSDKDNLHVRFHVNQGVVLFLAIIITNIVYNWVPFMGRILGFTFAIVTMVLSIIGVVNAVKGQNKKLPIIGNFNILS